MNITPAPDLYPEPARHVLHDPTQLTVWELSGQFDRAAQVRFRLEHEQRTARMLGTTADGLLDYANPALLPATITGRRARIEAAA